VIRGFAAGLSQAVTFMVFAGPIWRFRKAAAEPQEFFMFDGEAEPRRWATGRAA